MRIGAVGIDSSHLGEFTRRIVELRRMSLTACEVVAQWDPEPGAVSPARRGVAEELGLAAANSLDDLLDQVDGVMVLSADGGQHAEPTIAALRRGLPVFVDKPLTCCSREARAILAATTATAPERTARCFSSSCLRFAAALADIPFAQLGRIVAIDACGPDQRRTPTDGLWYYAYHTVELADAIVNLSGLSAAIKRLRASQVAKRCVAEVECMDGLSIQLRFEQEGQDAFAATIHGPDRTHQLVIDDVASAYDRLVRAMVGFFGGDPSPVPLNRTVSMVDLVERMHRSIEGGGAWVQTR